MNDSATTTGTIEDVAAFFRVSVRTVSEWKSERPPRLAFWQISRNICFGEEAIVALRVKHRLASGRLEPGEAEETARKEWRAHLGVRRAERQEVAELQRRIERLEAMLTDPERTQLAA